VINLSTRRVLCFEIEPADLILWAMELERQKKLIASLATDQARLARTLSDPPNTDSTARPDSDDYILPFLKFF